MLVRSSKISNLGSTWNQLCKEISIESYMVTPLTCRLELLPVDGVCLDAFECPLNSLCFFKNGDHLWKGIGVLQWISMGFPSKVK